MSPRAIVRRARAVGLDRLAVTDHNAIQGALRAREIDPDLIVVGEEIRLDSGLEMIGLFLTELVPPHRPADETAARIRDQGGLVYVPHPFAYVPSRNAAVAEITRHADIVEVYNGRAFWPAWNRKARDEVARRGFRGAASSDAHLPGDLGRAYTEVAAFDDPAQLLESLARAKYVTCGTASPLGHLATLSIGLAKGIRGHKRDD